MKNVEYILKRYTIWLIVIITVLAIVVLRKSESVGEYVLKHYEEATEILYHENISWNQKKYDVCFFFDDNGFISCALLKKEWIGYQKIRVSGKLSLSNSGYLCSFFRNGDEDMWIDWGIITDDSVTSVQTEYGEMKMVECKPYSYKIVWLIGNGEEPQSHVELK